MEPRQMSSKLSGIVDFRIFLGNYSNIFVE
jgi:hypothetical protein